MILNKNRNIPENDKCIICKNYITISDIQKFNSRGKLQRH